MISMENIILKRLHKRNAEIQRNHEHKEKHVIENQFHMGSMLTKLENTNYESQNHNHEFSI